MGNTIIGPVTIGDKVNLVQNLAISGLDHNVENVDKTIAEQGVNTKYFIIEDDGELILTRLLLPELRSGSMW